ncbi:MAG: hypothetical protein ACKVI4_18200 [Actinomycetales bacterium]
MSVVTDCLRTIGVMWTSVLIALVYFLAWCFTAATLVLFALYPDQSWVAAYALLACVAPPPLHVTFVAVSMALLGAYEYVPQDWDYRWPYYVGDVLQGVGLGVAVIAYALNSSGMVPLLTATCLVVVGQTTVVVKYVTIAVEVYGARRNPITGARMSRVSV